MGSLPPAEPSWRIAVGRGESAGVGSREWLSKIINTVEPSYLLSSRYSIAPAISTDTAMYLSQIVF
jgi:hypothetical protein